MRLTLVRHGQTPSNVLGLLDTAPPGPGLTDLGRLQAAAVPGALRGQAVDALFASDQLRARETAAPLAASRGLSVQIRQGLREIDAGELEMRADAGAVRLYIATLKAWLEDDLRRRMPGGPSGWEVLERFDEAVVDMARIAGGDGSVVAVSHGAAIRVWATIRARNLTRTLGEASHLGNTGAVVLDGHPGGEWRAVSWSEQALGGAALDAEAEGGPAAEAPAEAVGAGAAGDAPVGDGAAE